MLFSCKTKNPESKKDSKITIENEEDYIDILGVFERNELNTYPHSEWFEENYDDYLLDEETAKKIKPLINDVEITAFMGTWCTDCLLYTSPSPRDGLLSRMPSSA